jgi:outer membrane protein insertion porin family
VKVEEQPTGELQFGVGYSSYSGALFDIGISQRNLLGTGNSLSATLDIAQQQKNVNVSYTNPYFLGRHLMGGLDLFANSLDYRNLTGYTSNTYGASLRTGFSYNEYLYQRFTYQLVEQNLTGLTSTSAEFIKEQAGSSLVSQVSQVIFFDHRNNVIDPSGGYFLSLSSDLAGLGGNQRFVRGGVGGAIYYSPFEGWIASLSASGTYIVGLGQEIKIYQRSQLGGQTLRGFDDFGASPRDAATGDAVGGDWMAVGVFELRVPLGLPKDVGIKTRIFSDWGIIGPPKDLINSGTVNVLWSKKVRGSAGIGFDWQSPVGVISIDYAPLIFNAQPFDIKNHFRINFGQHF